MIFPSVNCHLRKQLLLRISEEITGKLIWQVITTPGKLQKPHWIRIWLLRNALFTVHCAIHNTTDSYITSRSSRRPLALKTQGRRYLKFKPFPHLVLKIDKRVRFFFYYSNDFTSKLSVMYTEVKISYSSISCKRFLYLGGELKHNYISRTLQSSDVHGLGKMYECSSHNLLLTIALQYEEGVSLVWYLQGPTFITDDLWSAPVSILPQNTVIISLSYGGDTLEPEIIRTLTLHGCRYLWSSEKRKSKMCLM